MVVVLTDDTARQFAVVQDERVAGVIRQGDAPLGCCLLVQIGIRGVGYQLVPHAGHKEVARRYLGILLVELVDLLLEVTPLLSALRLLHLHGNALCQVIVEFERNGNGGIAARLLEIAVVLHPLAITLVHRIVLLVKLVVEVAPGGILVFITACIHVVDHYDLRAVDDLLSCGNAQGAIDDLTEHIRPNGLEMGSRCPVATAIAINDLRVGLCEALAAVRPRQFRTVPDGTAVDARLFHHRTDAGSTRILALATALQVAHGTLPSAVVVAHAIVLGQPGDERSNSHTLVVVETARRGVLIKPENALWILLTSFEQLRLALHLTDGVQRMTPDVATEAHRQETTILVGHLYQIGKQGPARRLFRRALVARFVEAPELLGIVPA